MAATVTLSKTAEAWDRRYLSFARQSDPRFPIERSAPAYGWRAWLQSLMKRA